MLFLPQNFIELKNFYAILLLSNVFIYSATLQAQNIKSEEITYYYFRLPMQPLDKGIKNYQINFEAPFEAKNKQLQQEYEQQTKEAGEKYVLEMAEYNTQVKVAETRYDKELAEYNKKSAGEKWVEKKILEENNKPVKQLPQRPYQPVVNKPVLQTIYDLKLLSNTYIDLEGLQKTKDNGLKILVTLYGYDYSQPRVLGENSGTSIYYHTEFSYRHPMAVKVNLPDGKELLNLTPSELNIYKNYRGNAGGQQVNSEALIKSSEEKVLQDNLFFMNDLLNNRYCFSKVKRTAKLYFIKNRQDEYADLTKAFNEASAALPTMQQDSTTAKENLKDPIVIWNTALKESDITNRKARIDKDVTIAICFNLLETYFATANAEGAKPVLDKLNTINLSSDDRKIKMDFDLLFADLKKRQLNNK